MADPIGVLPVVGQSLGFAPELIESHRLRRRRRLDRITSWRTQEPSQRVDDVPSEEREHSDESRHDQPKQHRIFKPEIVEEAACRLEPLETDAQRADDKIPDPRGKGSFLSGRIVSCVAQNLFCSGTNFVGCVGTHLRRPHSHLTVMPEVVESFAERIQQVSWEFRFVLR